MKQLVSVNLTTRTAKDWTPPELTFGESLTLALRFYKNSDGEEIEAGLTINSLKASIGQVDARPRGGAFAIKIGTAPSSGANTTAALDSAIPANKLKDALNAVSAHSAYGDARVVFTDDSWLIFFGDQSEQVPMTVVNNGLWPISYGRITAWQVDGKWVHELRLTRAPVAFTSSHDIVLPPAPSITRIEAGGTDGTFTWNEIQQLYVPAEFRGAYSIHKGYGKTTLLSREDDTDAIQEALQVLGEGDFKVTLPLSQKPAIEFIGDLAGAPQDLLTVQVEQAPAGDLTFTLDLDRAELAALLRRESPVTLPLEIRVVGTDEGGFTDELVALVLDVVIKRPVVFPELAQIPVVDWLVPTSPVDYVPFTLSQVLTGQQQAFSAVIGNGLATSFNLAHGLASELCQVVVRENTSPGRLLRDSEYTVTLNDANSLTVSGFGATPTTDQYAVFVVAIGPASVFQAHTNTVPQIVAGGGYPSLPDFMDDIGERVETLEAILPSTGPAAVTSQPSGIEIALPEIKDVLFFKGPPAELKEAYGENGADAAKLGRPPLLLPALHKSSSTSYTSGALPAIAADTLWQNNSSGVLEMGRGLYGGRVAVSGFFASDGRVRYAVKRQGATTSYFPTGFERELWRIFINEKMLRLNRTLDVQFGLALQIVNATSNGQWLLVIEKGEAPSQSSPSTPATNLENITWTETPILSQRLILTGNRQTHSFGCRIKRTLVSLADTLKLDTMLYGVWEGNDAAAPASANFALRARLIQFDTENALATDARGWIALETIGPDKAGKPKAIII